MKTTENIIARSIASIKAGSMHDLPVLMNTLAISDVFVLWQDGPVCEKLESGDLAIFTFTEEIYIDKLPHAKILQESCNVRKISMMDLLMSEIGTQQIALRLNPYDETLDLSLPPNIIDQVRQRAIHLMSPIKSNPPVNIDTTKMQNSSGLANLRFTGVYQSKPEEYFMFLRFFEDGVVLGVPTTLLFSPENAFEYLQAKNTKGVKFGNYVRSGDQVSFSLQSTSGSVDYKGYFDNNHIILDVYSHINGDHSSETFYFIPL